MSRPFQGGDIITQHAKLTEAFAHMGKVPKSHFLAHMHLYMTPGNFIASFAFCPHAYTEHNQCHEHD